METGKEFDPLTHQVIGCAIEVHRQLGPGLLEPVYRTCLAYELTSVGRTCECELPVPVHYKGWRWNADSGWTWWLIGNW